ncbi:MAG: rhamnulokinase family protein [Lacipirellulaceae bacterium]
MSAAHLAFDLGASSGRAIVGVLQDDGKLSLEEVHRFEHHACPTPTGPVWDLTGIWLNLLTGLKSGSQWCRDNQVKLASVGVDTWGVDWTLLGSSGEVLSLPHCYRDPQNEQACQRVMDQLGGFEKLYARTGIQLLPFNSLFQLAARYEREPQLFEAATKLVFLPDLLHYWLSGEVAIERTIASTSSMLQVESGEWDRELVEQLGLPTHILGDIVEPGTSLGKLRREVAESAGVDGDVEVIVPATHDTGSAIAAVPADEATSWAYLSSGTWSLLGAELAEPCFSDDCREIPLTNERGVSGTIRLLKNIGGLWLVQEVRRDLQSKGQDYDFAQLTQEARSAEAGRTLVDPNYPEFAAPGKMIEKIQTFARKTDQPVPESVGQIVRSCLESLALCYDDTLGQLEKVLDQKVDVLHLIGGGTKNDLLNELTAEATGKTVAVGPVEATAIGNLLVQAIGCGELGSLNELRHVVADSFGVQTLSPPAEDRWQEQRTRYRSILS